MFLLNTYIHRNLRTEHIRTQQVVIMKDFGHLPTVTILLRSNFTFLCGFFYDIIFLRTYIIDEDTLSSDNKVELWYFRYRFECLLFYFADTCVF